jgi:hypothetical protein
MPHFKAFGESVAGIELNWDIPMNQNPSVKPPTFNHAFFEELGEKGFSRRSFDKWERIMHSHGEGPLEVYYLRYGEFPKVVDVIIYPESSS